MVRAKFDWNEIVNGKKFMLLWSGFCGDGDGGGGGNGE